MPVYGGDDVGGLTGLQHLFNADLRLHECQRFFRLGTGVSSAIGQILYKVPQGLALSGEGAWKAQAAAERPNGHLDAVVGVVVFDLYLCVDRDLGALQLAGRCAAVIQGALEQHDLAEGDLELTHAAPPVAGTPVVPAPEWQMIHQPRACFELIVFQIEAKRLPTMSFSSHGVTMIACMLEQCRRCIYHRTAGVSTTPIDLGASEGAFPPSIFSTVPWIHCKLRFFRQVVSVENEDNRQH